MQCTHHSVFTSLYSSYSAFFVKFIRKHICKCYFIQPEQQHTYPWTHQLQLTIPLKKNKVSILIYQYTSPWTHQLQLSIPFRENRCQCNIANQVQQLQNTYPSFPVYPIMKHKASINRLFPICRHNIIDLFSRRWLLLHVLSRVCFSK